MAELIIASGKMKGRKLLLPDNREIVIGRDESCQLQIPSTLVSRRHCVIKATRDGIAVRDLESQNGTYVNDVAISAAYVMKGGDVLRVGGSLFEVPRQKSTDNKSGHNLSDDTIASFIAGDENTLPPSKTDTTVIKGRQTIQTAAVSATASQPAMPTLQAASVVTPSAATPQRGPQRPLTVKEQAAQIIKRHWEIMRTKQVGNESS